MKFLSLDPEYHWKKYSLLSLFIYFKVGATIILPLSIIVSLAPTLVYQIWSISYVTSTYPLAGIVRSCDKIGVAVLIWFWSWYGSLPSPGTIYVFSVEFIVAWILIFCLSILLFCRYLLIIALGIVFYLKVFKGM